MLRSIRAELDQPTEIDANTNLLLHKLHEDIEVLLDLTGESSEEQHQEVRSGLKDSIEHFEESHPSFTATANRVLDMLVSIGL
jgi:ElaB/YqjD/DUF883 family membrane-anchored ribosome-binding protein